MNMAVFCVSVLAASAISFSCFLWLAALDVKRNLDIDIEKYFGSEGRPDE